MTKRSIKCIGIGGSILALALTLAVPVADTDPIHTTQTNQSDTEQTDTGKTVTFRAPPSLDSEHHPEWLEWYRTADELSTSSSLHRDNLMIWHDFEVMFRPDRTSDGSLQVLALLVQKEILLGTYEPTANEKLLHDWTMEKYPPPATLVEIDVVLLEIVGTEENLHFAEEVHETMTEAANRGQVPTPLKLSDLDYWYDQAFLWDCEHIYEDCDPAHIIKEMANSRKLTP